MVSVTFNFVASVYFSFTTITTPQSTAAKARLTCAIACGQHGTCGGIVWDTSKTPPCQLVVDPSEPGSVVSSSTSAFRMANYRGGLLQQIMPFDMSWQAAKSLCQAHSLQLLPYPVSLKERAILSIRPKMFTYVDVKRRASDGAFVDGQGQVVSPTAFNWGAGPYGHGCLQLGYGPLAYVDQLCDFESQTVTFCIR